jgi:hypothetical protein
LNYSDIGKMTSSQAVKFFTFTLPLLLLLHEAFMAKEKF